MKSTSPKYIINFLRFFLRFFDIFEHRRSSTVDFIIWFIVLLTENSSYVQISCFRSIDCVLIDSAISIFPRREDSASVCGIYFFIGSIFACRNKFSIDIFVGEINCIDTKRIRNDALCNYNLISI